VFGGLGVGKSSGPAERRFSSGGVAKRVDVSSRRWV
jgi:hypothetical protein